jgi:hypothetical protein
MKKYAEHLSSSESFALLATGVQLADDGTRTAPWSFAWSYWFIIILIPSMLLSYPILWLLRKINYSNHPKYPNQSV